MNTYLSAEVATEQRRDRIADANEYRRSRAERAPKAAEGQQRHRRNRRVSAFLKDLAAASL